MKLKLFTTMHHEQSHHSANCRSRKSVEVCNVPNGCIVNVSSFYEGSVAEALTFVPDVHFENGTFVALFNSKSRPAGISHLFSPEEFEEMEVKLLAELDAKKEECPMSERGTTSRQYLFNTWKKLGKEIESLSGVLQNDFFDLLPDTTKQFDNHVNSLIEQIDKARNETISMITGAIHGR